jgi:phage terminase large subunit
MQLNESWVGIRQYDPRPQFRAFHGRKQRWAAIVAHRRCGKTVACVADLVMAACLSRKQDARYAYVAPQFNQAKDVAWLYVKRLSADIPGAEFNESELRVDFPNGARVRLYGADNADRLRGLFLDGVLLDEYADMRPSVWGEVIRPMLSDRSGWAVFIGTPKGRNEFYDKWEESRARPDWFSLMLRASETAIIRPEELEDAKSSMTPEQYEQEFECSFDAAIMGAYYGREIADAEREGRICELAPDPVLPVNTVWDLGKGVDSTSIFFWQVAPNGIRVIDFYENQGHDLDHYSAELKLRAQAGGYRFGTHYLPHDVRAVILGMKRTRLEQLIELLKGDKFHVVINHEVADGINAARMTLKRTWFDGDKCKFALEALRQYRTEYDEKAKVFKKSPKHDWSSHCADSFRYLAMAWKELRADPPKPKPVTAITYEADPDTGFIKSNVTMNDLIKRMERKAKRGR